MSLFDVGTMTELLNRSLTGAAVILAVLVLRLGMKRFPKKYVCLLWLAAFGRLLFFIPVPSASGLFPAAEPLRQVAVEVDGRPGTGTVLQLSTGLEPVDSAVNELLWQLLEPAPLASADPVQIYAFAFQWLWLGGMAVLLLTGLFRYGLLKRRVSDAVPAEETQCTVRGKRLERVYITDRIQMPMVLGIWKPRILLPSACSGEGRKEERELILAHEQAHRLRYDHVTKVFVFGVLVIHWFNPLAWAAFLLYCRDVEMACDEKVMEWLGEESRKPYSLALLRFEEERSALLIPLAFGESSARERIRHILDYRKPGSWVTALALLLAALAAGLFLMAPDGKAQDAVSIIGGADGPTSIFLAGKVGEGDGEEKIPAAVLDLEKAKKEAYGAAAELDWVSGGKISLHGSFGYLSFLLKANGKSELAAAFTLEEAGPIVVQGDRYTEVVGGRDSALVVTEPYKEDGDSRIFWYLEDGGTVEPLPEDMTNLFLEQSSSGVFRDAPLAEEYRQQVEEKIAEIPGNHLVYGPVEIPETDSIICGFLAADGPDLEDLWYGIWYEMDGRIEKYVLFP
ncbi:MAG: M56 family metallopeptidase [Lachnospiraceae bacterium]|nr:M56 family metallopeptidase [Lachnospiraceae bacterium]